MTIISPLHYRDRYIVFKGPYHVRERLRDKSRERFLLRRYILGVNVAWQQTMGEIAFWIWTLFLVDVDHIFVVWRSLCRTVALGVGAELVVDNAGWDFLVGLKA
jgi:hypothetical protein